MKKFAAIALVAFFLALPFVHLGKGFFVKEQETSSAKRSKKTVQISEISQDLYSLESLSGNWMLFLHYANETRSVDITIDTDGSVSSRDEAIIDDSSVSVDKDGFVEMDNQKAQLKGTMNPEGNHLDGMAVIQGIKTPVPFSAFKIQESAGSK